MRSMSFLIAACAALMLSACGEQGKYYEQTPQTIRSSLRAATLPYHVMGSLAQGSRVSQPNDQTTVVSVLGPKNSEMIRFVATVTPEGTGSRVLVEVAPPETSNKERATKVLQSNHFAVTMMKQLANEHVAAAIERRPFNMTFGANPMAKGMMAANPAMRQQVEDANRMAEMMNKYEHNRDSTGHGSSNDLSGSEESGRDLNDRLTDRQNEMKYSDEYAR